MDKDNSYGIPFGAKDSELKGWEYTIPEGMEAEIKDGKIIVREKESEDERIRNALIQHIKYNVSGILGWRKEELIAWLEKQGEQKSVLDFKASNFYVSKVDGKIHDITYNSTDKVEPKFKVGDVIRNKWSNRTKTIIAIDDYQYTVDDGMPAQPIKVNINKQDNWELVEENPAWSEEDIKTIERIVCILDGIRYYNTVDNKQEKPYQSEIDFLKSLKERYTWKPSDEQMKQLGLVVELNKDTLIGEGLMTLFNDLKKLKR